MEYRTLPTEPPGIGPRVETGLWFVGSNNQSEWQFDNACTSAILTAGIGERECPTISAWLSYCIAGAITASLSEKIVIAPAGIDESSLQIVCWDALWVAVNNGNTKLDRSFLAAMCRELMPRFINASGPIGERPYRESRFEHPFRQRYAGPADQSIGNLYIETIKKGRLALKELPQPTVATVSEVAQNFPPFLESAIERIRSSYLW